MLGQWSQRSDGELLRSRESEAFREFYIRHERTVVTFLGSRVRSREVVADITAETFATALLAAKRFRDDGTSAIGWLLGIARNKMHQYFERQGIETRALQRLGVDRISVSDESLERVEAVMDAEQPDNPILTLLEELPEEQRATVRAHVIEEQSYDEIARRWGISNSLARQRLSRGLRSMRVSLKEGGR